jgi:hypothetical protein
MTPLREQLKRYRSEYDSIIYPGDLGREMLSPRMRMRNMFVLGLLGTSAVAAAAVVAAILARPLMMPASSHPQPYLPIVKEIHLPEKMQFNLPSIPSLPGIPTNLSLRDFSNSLLPQGLRVPFLEDAPASTAQPKTQADHPEHA